MRAECEHHRRAFLLGASDPPHCEDCRRFRDLETQTAEKLRRARPRWTASVALRERVAIALFLAWRGADAGRSRAQATAELLVADHLRFARTPDRLQVATSSPSELQ